MDIICYLCNKKTDEWCDHLVELYSKYTKTLIIDFLKQFLDDFPTQRYIDDPSNRICQECVDNINDFDWMLTTVARKESELCRMLLGTERLFNRHQIKMDQSNSETSQNEDSIFHEIDDSINQPDDPEGSVVLLRKEKSGIFQGKGTRFNIKLKKPGPNASCAMQSIKSIYMKQNKHSVKLRAPTQPRTQCLECNDGVWYTRWDYKVSPNCDRMPKIVVEHLNIHSASFIS